MSNFYSTHSDQFEYVDGAEAAFTAKVDRKRLASAVRRAANSKGGKARAGAITVTARWIKKPSEVPE